MKWELMKRYEFFPYTVVLIALVFGLFMTIMPKQSTKKEFQDSEEMIKKTRKAGIILIILAIFFSYIFYISK